MRRRAFLLAAPLVALAGEPRVTDVFAALASALSEGDAALFLRAFDSKMPGFEALRADIESLVAQTEVVSSIELLGDEGDAARRTVDVDWTMQIRERREAGRVVQRREKARFRLERRGRRWTIAAFEPASLFTPPRR